MNSLTGKCYICGKSAEEVRKLVLDKSTEALHLSDYNFAEDEYIREEQIKINQIAAVQEVLQRHSLLNLTAQQILKNYRGFLKDCHYIKQLFFSSRYSYRDQYDEDDDDYETDTHHFKFSENRHSLESQIINNDYASSPFGPLLEKLSVEIQKNIDTYKPKVSNQYTAVKKELTNSINDFTSKISMEQLLLDLPLSTINEEVRHTIKNKDGSTSSSESSKADEIRKLVAKLPNSEYSENFPNLIYLEHGGLAIRITLDVCLICKQILRSADKNVLLRPELSMYRY